VSPSPGSPPDPTDAELVDRFRSGQPEAFAALVRRHERRVYNLAYRLVGRAEDARDATQDAFLSCYRHLGTFRGDAAFSTWLHRIAANACFDLLRKRGVEAGPLPEDVEPAPAHDHADAAAAAVDVHRALSRVPFEYRAVLVLHDAQGLPYDEIASILEIPVGTVKSRLHRGRLALARVMAGEPSPASAASNREHS